MANIGFSQPYTADYTNTNGTITYANLTKLGKGTTFSVAIDGKEPQILYADNGPAESVSTFGGGTATLGIDELSLAEAANILGLTTPTSTGGLTFSADAVAPYKALCAIAKKVYQGVVKWRLIVLYKVQFMTPDYTVDTEGDTVTFRVFFNRIFAYAETAATQLPFVSDTFFGVWVGLPFFKFAQNRRLTEL